MSDGFGNWFWDKFSHLLPLPILLHIAANNEPLSATSKDSVGRKLRVDLQLSIKFAYAIRRGAIAGVNEDLWKATHKFRRLQRVKIYLWLLSKNKLMTKAKMVRQHFMKDSWCSLCASLHEDADHLFQQCPQSVLIWSEVVKADKLDEFC
ncbi:hypothetical protein V6N11_021899 [Hibiscus sabdariffa]|uniref:Reverse transcriptase zinc-binding domain-containing protein n=1 Tax=Hibiscus sabdariffa TaxID=183260 RepID=A0ABR2THL0_9ROSI